MREPARPAMYRESLEDSRKKLSIFGRRGRLQATETAIRKRLFWKEAQVMGSKKGAAPVMAPTAVMFLKNRPSWERSSK